MTQQFVASAKRAARIGFDFGELHIGHGYLLHQFLSPLANRRDDEYGGSAANRMRYPLEVFRAVRDVWPEDKPLGVRVSATDWVDGGWTPEETVVFAQELKALGCDFIDVTSGQVDPRQKIPFAPGYNVPFAEKVKRETGMPVMAVGMISRPRQAEEIVSVGPGRYGRHCPRHDGQPALGVARRTRTGCRDGVRGAVSTLSSVGLEAIRIRGS